MVKQGDDQLMDGKFDRALELYMQAEPLAPSNPYIHFRIARAAGKLGKADVGLQAITELILLSPEAAQDQEVVDLKAAFEAQRTANNRAAPGQNSTRSTNSPSDANQLVKAGQQSRLGEDNRKSFDSITVRQLNIVDASGTPRIILSTDSDGAIVKMLNKKGNVALLLAMESDGQGRFELLDKDKNPLVQIGVDRLSNGEVKTGNAAGNALTSLTSDSTGAGLVTVSDYRGTNLVQVGAGNNGFGAVLVGNSSGYPLVAISSSSSATAGIIDLANSAGYISLQIDGEHRRIWRANFPGDSNGLAWPSQ
jgi:hypothetical protein